MSRRAGNLPLRSSFPLPSKRGRCAQRSEPAAPPRPYDRRTELTRILPLWPHELNDASPEGRRRALGAERRRGITGHWTYDLARHAELLRVYRLELAASGGNRE